MKRSKKGNGSTQPEPEVIHAPGEAPPASLDEACEQALREGKSEHEGRRIERIDLSADVLEAATMEPSERTAVLYVGWRYPGRQPPTLWRSAVRFDLRDVGGQQFVMVRPMRTDIGANALAGLEQAFGRDGLSLYNTDRSFPATPVTLQGAVLVTQQSGSRTVRIKHRGLWLGAGFRFSKTEQPPNYDRDVPGGQAYKPMAIA